MSIVLFAICPPDVLTVTLNCARRTSHCCLLCGVRHTFGISLPCNLKRRAVTGLSALCLSQKTVISSTNVAPWTGDRRRNNVNLSGGERCEEWGMIKSTDSWSRSVSHRDTVWSCRSPEDMLWLQLFTVTFKNTQKYYAAELAGQTQWIHLICWKSYPEDKHPFQALFTSNKQFKPTLVCCAFWASKCTIKTFTQNTSIVQSVCMLFT